MSWIVFYVINAFKTWRVSPFKFNFGLQFTTSATATGQQLKTETCSPNLSRSPPPLSPFLLSFIRWLWRPPGCINYLWHSLLDLACLPRPKKSTAAVLKAFCYRTTSAQSLIASPEFCLRPGQTYNLVKIIRLQVQPEFGRDHYGRMVAPATHYTSISIKKRREGFSDFLCQAWACFWDSIPAILILNCFSSRGARLSPGLKLRLWYNLSPA